MATKLQKMVRFNKIMALLHAVQALAVLLLSTSFSTPITTSYQVFNPEARSLEITSQTLFDVRLAYLVAGFFALSALAHAFIGFFAAKWYVKNLKNGINMARWYEYAASASLMMVAIALLSGIEDLSTLLMIFGLTAIMNLMGLVMEVHNQSTLKTNWLSYWIGCLAGILPWIVIGIYFWGSEQSGVGDIPTFVYWIYLSIFTFFNLFAINMVLQYKAVGRWKDYLYGERMYIILSLVAKSLLAWQVFAGALRPV
jgi:hypothetical protein